MLISIRAATTVNLALLLCNPLAWLLLGLLIYSFCQEEISLLLKTILIILYSLFSASHGFFSIFVGAMAGGAPGVPEIYVDLLFAFIVGILGIVGLGLLYVLFKR
ncbi:hypothetical protein BH09DEP1_BH09DEP1_4840 [soil metagenome]